MSKHKDEKIWQAIGPNFVVDTPGQDLGMYQGKRRDVADFIELDHPSFRDHLAGRSFPRAYLDEVKPVRVTREIIRQRRAAKKAEEVKEAKKVKKKKKAGQRRSAH